MRFDVAQGKADTKISIYLACVHHKHIFKCQYYIINILSTFSSVLFSLGLMSTLISSLLQFISSI